MPTKLIPATPKMSLYMEKLVFYRSKFPNIYRPPPWSHTTTNCLTAKDTLYMTQYAYSSKSNLTRKLRKHRRSFKTFDNRQNTFRLCVPPILIILCLSVGWPMVSYYTWYLAMNSNESENKLHQFELIIKMETHTVEYISSWIRYTYLPT